MCTYNVILLASAKVNPSIDDWVKKKKDLLHLSNVVEQTGDASLAQEHSRTLPLNSSVINGSNNMINLSNKKIVPLSQSKDADLNYTDTGQRSNRWFDGLLRCLKPVWTVLGKTSTHELKEDNWEILFDDIKDLQFLGSGAQGAVFCGHLNGELVAVKKVREKSETDVKHLKKLSHCNVISFKGVCVQPPCFCIIMEYCPSGTLHNLLRQGTEIPPKKVMEWSKQVAGGMNYLHTHKIIHRDLKSENNESRFNLSSDHNRVRVWRPCGERLNPAFALQRHTAPTAGVMVWLAIAYNTWSPLVLIRGTMTAQQYVHDILQPHVLPLIQQLSSAIFQQDNARPHGKGVTKLSLYCYYPSLVCPFSRFVSNRAYLGSFGTASWASHEFERTRGRVTPNMNEMSQDIIQNLYATMPDHIASCIRA
ncbi:mitogen-activated protein kinase kinase kinase 13-B [Trichonephila clavipes]|uniref:Mitogen-activated protein kinase kinase kinase 13-B n=1 Tax=Trichonephila clavipes TaxID=2585209 RepID=A0A8X6RXT0_TRICX|nr:mitogen-activated protein kinase kinase kinase 13-B [Trichonephila clavipes]